MSKTTGSLAARSSAAVSANGMKRRKPKARKRPEWDSTINDLTALKSTPEEMDRRRLIHQSQNADMVRLEKLQKHVAKLNEQKQLATGSSVRQPSDLFIREILNGNSQLYEALETSDRLLASVKDLLGDSTKKYMGLPHVTKAPHHSSHDRSLPEAAEILSRLDLNSESVMDKSALNDVDDDKKSQSSAAVDDDDDPSLKTGAYKSMLDMARFQQLLKQAENYKLGFADPASDLSSYSEQGQKMVPRPQERLIEGKKQQQQRRELVADFGGGGDGRHVSNCSGRKTDAGEGFERRNFDVASGGRNDENVDVGSELRTPVTSPRCDAAMNDTVRVNRTKSIFNIDNSKPSMPTMDDFCQILELVQTTLADCQTSSARNGLRSPVHHPATYGSYTMALLDTIAKMSLILKHNELRSRQETSIQEHLSQEVYRLRGLLEAQTTDMLAMQEEYSRLRNEFVKFKRDTECQWSMLNRMLASHGVNMQLSSQPEQQQLLQQPQPPQLGSAEYSTQAALSPLVQPFPVCQPSVTADGTTTSDNNWPVVSGVNVQQAAVQLERASNVQVKSVTRAPADVLPMRTNNLVEDVDAVCAEIPSVQPMPPTATSFLARSHELADPAYVIPNLHSHESIDARRQAIRQQLAELNQQRMLAQAKLDELRSGQQFYPVQQTQQHKQKVSPSISPITVSSEMSASICRTQISTNSQVLYAAQPGNGISRKFAAGDQHLVHLQS